MKLYTEREHGDYERRVDIFVNNSQNEIPSINDDQTCKLLIITSGNLSATINKKAVKFSRHTAIFLSNKDNIVVVPEGKFKATTIFFKPSAINDLLTYEALYSGKYEEHSENIGTTIYQDYRAVRNFIRKDGYIIKYSSLVESSFENIMDIISKMKYELNEQYDGYWPCRSRSFFLELLFILNSRCEDDLHYLEDDSVLINKIIAFLNVHIDEKVSQEMITDAFHINRNSLNRLFLDNTGRTCLTYLMKLRIDLSKMLLSETQLPIAEIGRRVSFTDQNYFTRVFNKECGMTPTKYRETYTMSSCMSALAKGI